MICLFLILIEKDSLTLYPSLPHAGVLNSRRSKETCWKFGLSAKTSPFNGGESMQFRLLRVHARLRMLITPWQKKHSHGKSSFSIGNTSSKGPFSIAMLVYRMVSDACSFLEVFLLQSRGGIYLSLEKIMKQQQPGPRCV